MFQIVVFNCMMFLSIVYLCCGFFKNSAFLYLIRKISLSFLFLTFLSFICILSLYTSLSVCLMSKEAYVTLVATDSYGSGALVLGHRLRDLGTQKDLICLVTNNVSRSVIDHLSQLYQVISVETLYSNDHDNLELLGRPDLDITFTKIHVWKLTQYKKIVFLDADTLPLKNVDELFERPHFSAAPDAGWPDCFNSGVFVTEPSDADYQALKKMATENGSFDGK